MQKKKKKKVRTGKKKKVKLSYPAYWALRLRKCQPYKRCMNMKRLETKGRNYVSVFIESKGWKYLQLMLRFGACICVCFLGRVGGEGEGGVGSYVICRLGSLPK